MTSVMARLLRPAGWGGAVLCLLVAGCSTGTGAPAAHDAGGCPTLSTTCPSPPPSWQAQVQPIVSASCATSACHGDGGVEGTAFNYTTYAGVKSASVRMITQVNDCLMPLQDASPPPPPLSAANRQTLLSWLVCGAPDN